MNRLAPCGITAWSWVSALGAVHSGEPGVTLEASLSGLGLASHEEQLGIPGFSGRFPDELPPLPEGSQHRDSRCARLLALALAPLKSRIDAVKNRVGSDRVAVVLGSSTGGIDATEHALRYERAHGSLPPRYKFVDVHPYDSLLHLISELLEISGPSLIVSTACSSAGKAMASAQRLLHTHVADAALVGGADALCEMTVRGFSGLGVLSDDPCRPFDENRAGISIGEGAALLLLEAESEAPIQFLGAGESSDAYHATAPHPEGVGATMAMRACLEASGLEPADVGYLNAHGTGTEKNDAMEAIAIGKVLGDGVAFSSTKNKTGHQLGTAGGTEAIVCVQAVAEGRAPQDVSPEVWDADLAVRPQARADQRVDVALSNSFAFGGSNVTVAVGRKRASSPARVRAPGGCSVLGAALWMPHYESLDCWLSRSKSEPLDKPAARLLSARERGRASTLTRIFADLYGQLSPEGLEKPTEASSRLPTIYASRFGEMETTLKLLDQMEEEPRLSPIRFQASVHNTASGRISLCTKNRAFTTALAAGRSSFAMALMEAQAWLGSHGGEILVFVAEESLPDRLDKDLDFSPLGVGIHLAAPAARAGAPWGYVGPVAASGDKIPGVSRQEDLKNFEDAPPIWGLSLIEALVEKRTGPVGVGPGWAVDVRTPPENSPHS